MQESLSTSLEYPCSPWNRFEAAWRANLSVDRLRRYANERDRGSWSPAIGRYLWNLELARALYPILNWAEVALRNHLNHVISSEYPIGGMRRCVRVASWLDADPPVLLPKERAKVEQAKMWFDTRNAQPRRPGVSPKVLTEGRLVAELQFGFWTHLLDGIYADWRLRGGPVFWPRLLDRAFPNCPPGEKTRKNIHLRFTAIKEIRNRAFHHERISHQADLAFVDRALETLHWMDEEIARAVGERDRPPYARLLADGPQPCVEWAAARGS
jgi:hypothetical protein